MATQNIHMFNVVLILIPPSTRQTCNKIIFYRVKASIGTHCLFLFTKLNSISGAESQEAFIIFSTLSISHSLFFL